MLGCPSAKMQTRQLGIRSSRNRPHAPSCNRVHVLNASTARADLRGKHSRLEIVQLVGITSTMYKCVVFLDHFDTCLTHRAHTGQELKQFEVCTFGTP